ncbi:deoxyribodipyrimidine photo-lyase [Candidatus Gracilibacteria bacterium]|nr:deoxyribodipyrimidine photo-lyase [Candidatus Gracilibacteria bacterium]
MKQKIQIIWWKKNLRVKDNEILANINADIPVLGVYFFEPRLMQASDWSHFHLKFTLESLQQLKHNLESLGIPLLFLASDLPHGFEQLKKNYEIIHICAHEETGNHLSYMRDLEVISWCEASGIPLTEYPTNGVVRRLKSRDHWSQIWNERMQSPLVHHHDRYTPAHVSPVTLSYSEKIFQSQWKQAEHIQNLQVGGEQNADSILDNFLNQRSKQYSYHISKPAESTHSCSRLSPYISSGCISVRYIYLKSLLKIEQLKQIGDEASKKHIKQIRFFLARIHWQSHFIQKLEDEPELEYQNLNRSYDSIRQSPDESIIEAFFGAKTGIPYIDATMRQLQQTGWCNFRSRAILVSFICNSCMQAWQAVAARMARLFTDYEPGIHYAQFQMQAGTTGINAIRIYNPIKNGIEKDSEGKHIRNYLPELNSVPLEYIHEPWKWSDFGSVDYPEPIIDIESANRQARDILWGIKGKTPKDRKQKILKKHGSRKSSHPKSSRLNGKKEKIPPTPFIKGGGKRKTKICVDQIALFEA